MLFKFKLTGKKATAVAVGTVTFLLMPAGIVGSLTAAALAAMTTAVALTLQENDVSIALGETIDVMEDEDCRTVLENGTVIILAAIAMALPLAGVMGFLLKLATFAIAKKYFYFLIVQGGKKPTFNKELLNVTFRMHSGETFTFAI